MKQDFFLSNLKLFVLLLVFLCSCQKANQQNKRDLSEFNGSKTYYHNNMSYLVIEGTRGMYIVNLTLDSLEKENLQKKKTIKMNFNKLSRRKLEYFKNEVEEVLAQRDKDSIIIKDGRNFCDLKSGNRILYARITSDFVSRLCFAEVLVSKNEYNDLSLNINPNSNNNLNIGLNGNQVTKNHLMHDDFQDFHFFTTKPDDWHDLFFNEWLRHFDENKSRYEDFDDRLTYATKCFLNSHEMEERVKLLLEEKNEYKI